METIGVGDTTQLVEGSLSVTKPLDPGLRTEQMGWGGAGLDSHQKFKAILGDGVSLKPA